MTYAHISSRQRAGGVLMAGIGLAGVWLRWSGMLATGHAGRYDVLFPFFVVLGLALLCVPGYREERLARGEDLQNLKGLRLLTPRWWAITGAGVAVGVANFALYAIRVPH